MFTAPNLGAKYTFDHLADSSTKIEYANGDYLFCLNEDGSGSSTTINYVLYVPETKLNLLSLGQLSERGVDLKITGARMYLPQGGKTRY